MSPKFKILKPISFTILIILAVIGLLSIVYLFSFSKSSSHTASVPAVSNTTAVSNDDDNEKIEYNFHFDEPSNITGTKYSIMKIVGNGGEGDNEKLKRIGYKEPFIINYLFFNIDQNYFRLLFDRKVMIIEPNYRAFQFDTTKKKLVFKVIINDSNKDGYLNENDNFILFSSEKSGQDLTQITDSKLNVKSYTYLDNNNLLITLSIPEKDKPKEEWQMIYIQYDVNKNNEIKNNKFEMSFLEAIKIFKK